MKLCSPRPGPGLHLQQRENFGLLTVAEAGRLRVLAFGGWTGLEATDSVEQLQLETDTWLPLEGSLETARSAFGYTVLSNTTYSLICGRSL